MDKKEEFKVITQKYIKEKINNYGYKYTSTIYHMECKCCGKETINSHQKYIFNRCGFCRNDNLVGYINENGSTIIKRDVSSTRNSHPHDLVVKCHCEKEFKISKLAFSRGLKNHTPLQCKSCHSLSSNKQRAKTDVDSEIRRFMKSYIDSANLRNYVFTLNFDEFKQLCLQSCFYCDEPHSKYAHKIKHNETKKNGIDRKDSSVGYTLDNSVPCCSTCNKMKQTFTDIEFLKQIEKIYNNQKIRKNEL